MSHQNGTENAILDCLEIHTINASFLIISLPSTATLHFIEQGNQGHKMAEVSICDITDSSLCWRMKNKITGHSKVSQFIIHSLTCVTKQF